MTVEVLAGTAGLLLSLGFQYVPGLSGWYEGKNSQQKALIMGILIIIAGAGAFVLSCYGPYSYFECSGMGGWMVVELVIAALVANQAIHKVFKNFRAG